MKLSFLYHSKYKEYHWPQKDIHEFIRQYECNKFLPWIVSSHFVYSAIKIEKYLVLHTINFFSILLVILSNTKQFYAKQYNVYYGRFKLDGIINLLLLLP